MMPFDIQQTDLMLWGSLYVFAKWTIGFWLFRRAKAYVSSRRQMRTVQH
jgi:hypothetical protein